MFLGYATTIVIVISFLLLLFSNFLYRKNIFKILKTNINKNTLLFLLIILIFFISFLLIFVHPVEQLFFDENIYQGIALNIVHTGNSLWCQFGTGYLTHCYNNQLYHDPVGLELFLGIALVLFGSNPYTAYAFQLFIGVLSIIGVFLLSSLLTERKLLAPISAFIFALLPEVIIWSRTQAAPDLLFMMFTIYAFFFFVIFTKKENKISLLMFLSSLTLVFYSRIEAFVLLPIFLILYFVFGNSNIKETIKLRLKLIRKTLDDWKALSIFLIFIILLTPQIFYIYTENLSPQYGQSTGQKIISLSNFYKNINPNINFFLGTTSNYPSISSINLLVLSILGVFFIISFKKIKNKIGLLFMLLITSLVFFIFYTSFYAGSVNYGVDVRFMLEIMPFLAILSGFGILGLSDLILKICKKFIKFKRDKSPFLISLIIIFSIIIPFYLLVPFLTLPVSQMPQEYFNTQATNFIYSNYQKVPTSCLVFSFTPDIWYELNRSAAQVSYFSQINNNTINTIFKNYSCFVFDYGYWCTVSSYKNSTCGTNLYSYNLSVIATKENTQGSNFTLYKINNFN
ncbi:MAG: glycosyltransferase family 39 protein [Candidatus Micrarchaeaceae archaeon]